MIVQQVVNAVIFIVSTEIVSSLVSGRSQPYLSIHTPDPEDFRLSCQRLPFKLTRYYNKL